MKTEKSHLPAVIFKAVPSSPSRDEQSKWKNFWEVIFPWLKTKALQGERALEAQIRVLEAEASLKSGEALKARAEAARIAAETVEIFSRIELSAHPVKSATCRVNGRIVNSAVAEQMQRVSEMLDTLRTEFGGELLGVTPPSAVQVEADENE